MTKTSVADVLRELAKGDKSRSETARLRDVIDEVEAALDAGVSRSAVLEALHGQGFTMTLKSFESALYRIRKQRVKDTAGTPAAPIPAPLGRDQKPAAAPEPDANINEQSKETGAQTKKITNPQQVRAARKREINLDDYKD
jgi:hypothetical protein